MKRKPVRKTIPAIAQAPPTTIATGDPASPPSPPLQQEFASTLTNKRAHLPLERSTPTRSPRSQPRPPHSTTPTHLVEQRERQQSQPPVLSRPQLVARVARVFGGGRVKEAHPPVGRTASVGGPAPAAQPIEEPRHGRTAAPTLAVVIVCCGRQTRFAAATAAVPRAPRAPPPPPMAGGRAGAGKGGGGGRRWPCVEVAPAPHW